MTSLTNALREQGGTLAGERPRPADGKVFDLLKTKALLMQVVDSAPVRAQYPELYDATEEYLDRYGTEKAQAGEQAALSRVVALLDRLLGQRPADTGGMGLAGYLQGAGRPARGAAAVDVRRAAPRSRSAVRHVEDQLGVGRVDRRASGCRVGPRRTLYV